MLVVSRGREKVRGSAEQPERTQRRRLPQHSAAGSPGAASSTHPDCAGTRQELVAPPCPGQKVRLSPRSVPGEAQALHGDPSAGVTPTPPPNQHRSPSPPVYWPCFAWSFDPKSTFCPKR